MRSSNQTFIGAADPATLCGETVRFGDAGPDALYISFIDEPGLAAAVAIAVERYRRRLRMETFNERRGREAEPDGPVHRFAGWECWVETDDDLSDGLRKAAWFAVDPSRGRRVLLDWTPYRHLPAAAFRAFVALGFPTGTEAGHGAPLDGADLIRLMAEAGMVDFDAAIPDARGALTAEAALSQVAQEPAA